MNSRMSRYSCRQLHRAPHLWLAPLRSLAKARLSPSVRAAVSRALLLLPPPPLLLQPGVRRRRSQCPVLQHHSVPQVRTVHRSGQPKRRPGQFCRKAAGDSVLVASRETGIGRHQQVSQHTVRLSLIGKHRSKIGLKCLKNGSIHLYRFTIA